MLENTPLIKFIEHIIEHIMNSSGMDLGTSRKRTGRSTIWANKEDKHFEIFTEKRMNTTFI